MRRIILTSGLALSNPLLVQIMADVLGREIEVPDIRNPTAVGAAIHAAVAAGVVADFAAGGARFGARTTTLYRPDATHRGVYDALYGHYRDLSGNDGLRRSVRTLTRAEGGSPRGR